MAIVAAVPRGPLRYSGRDANGHDHRAARRFGPIRARTRTRPDDRRAFWLACSTDPSDPIARNLVAQTASDASDTGAYIDPSEIQDALRGEAQRTPAAARARLASLNAEVEIFEGQAADGILAVARRERADLVMMGTHGKTGIARARSSGAWPIR